MILKPLERLQLGATALTSYITANDGMRSVLGRLPICSEPTELEFELTSLRHTAPTIPQWRILDHCSAVGRIYALYEQFAESILSEWIEFRSADVKFPDLPKGLKDGYTEGFPYILSMLHKNRYEHLSRENLVAQYHQALSGSSRYKLQSECLTHHQNNLRWDDLGQIFARCGIDGIGIWVQQSKSLQLHFQSTRKIQEQTSTKLKELVEYRNAAAHGTVAVDEILGTQKLIDIIQFVMCLCDTLSQLVNHEALKVMLEDGRVSCVGTITENLSSNIVIAIVEGVVLKTGSLIAVSTDSSYHRMTIESIQINGTPLAEVNIANAKEIGMKLNSNAPKRGRIIPIQNTA